MKLGRDAFLYMSPRAPQNRFAQCMTCRDWIRDRHCVIHGPKIVVPGGASCGLYVWGQPQDKGAKSFPRVTPAESGLVDRKVRCENCRYFDDRESECELYKLLNEQQPNIWELDTDVEAQGCCNAQSPKTS